MIGLIFNYISDVVEIRIDGRSILFRTSQLQQFSTIDGLHLDKNGVIKEFPELKGREDWKEEAIKKFKEKINMLETEEKRAEYIIQDLSKHGYKPLYFQKSGFRPVKLYK